MDNYHEADKPSAREIRSSQDDDTLGGTETHNTSDELVANADELGGASSTIAKATSIVDKEKILSDTVAQSRLFKLPAELRNTIYHFALVTNDKVMISKCSGIPEPGLLLVNKVVRAEAVGIFYHDNHFCCEVSDYDHTPLQLLSQKKGPVLFNGSPRLVITVRIYPEERDWKDLVAWLHACQQGRSFGIRRSKGMKRGGPEERLIQGLFDLAYPDTDPTVKPRSLNHVLKAMRPVLVALHRDWARKNA